MKVSQRDLNTIYSALGISGLTGVAPEEIVKIVKMRKAMRPHFDSYKAFDEDVRKAQEDYERLAEIEQMGDKASADDKAWFAEHIQHFVGCVNMAIIPELNKEVEVEFEPLSPETIAAIAARVNISLSILEILI